MTQIGFTPGSVGVMAAAYAAVVPLLEVPSGILADRWSRNQIMVCATVALIASSLLGGLSTNVPTYIAAAMILGAYFALSSGTVDSIVYDVVLEETGSSDQYETVDRPHPDGRKRRVRGERARRWSAGRLDLGPAHLLRVASVRRDRDRGVPALRRAAPASRRGTRGAAKTCRAHLSDYDPRAGGTAGHAACGAGRVALPSRVRVRAAVAGRPCCSGRALRPLLGSSRLHAGRRRLPR